MTKKELKQLVDTVFKGLKYDIDITLSRLETRTFVSFHEMLGAIISESDELRDAIRYDDVEATTQQLFNIASVALLGIASIRSWTVK